MLENVDVKGHQFEEDLNGVLVCEVCQKWVCPADEPATQIQEKIDMLGPCFGS